MSRLRSQILEILEAEISKKIKKGMYWHVHHERLLEYCYDEGERQSYIAMYKPAYEIPLRQRLMQPVRGRLPWRLARACKKYTDSLNGRWPKKRRRLAKICRLLEKYKKEIEILHKKECPDCPWNGWTIFLKEVCGHCDRWGDDNKCKISATHIVSRFNDLCRHIPSKWKGVSGNAS